MGTLMAGRHISINKRSGHAMATWSSITGKKENRKKDDSYVVIGMNYGISSFLSWSKSICNLKIGMMSIERAPKTIASF
jgi:hypothetical protein